ncbi:TetR family transcriptional regulator [Phytoactinopolyspora alkaliphila]|uniref:TetR family transcriptional regulator n=1 Tax=Phytoactinopolyspora alkaliphila TaxID=1783498 RepID=A0A6N9YKF3_9ACTN|nr:TetR/AcrR family transcriptional regulator [Phytoactinopolyspora alkaliphila]NED95417.1 TetR family transcriptional regulator [Phytoactinopolyspora alkaliphila]
MRAQLSRRERKKLDAMRHIQQKALDLFDAHGYGHVTIERIAAEADVSPSSVYRYFGTKEQLVLYDEYDPELLAAFDDKLAVHDPVTSLRESLSTAFRSMLDADEDLIRRRMRYTMNEPSVRAEMFRQTSELETELGRLIARHSGRAAEDLDIRVIVAAIMAAFLAALMYWHDSDYQEPLGTIIDRTLDRIGSGLTLD